MLSGSRDPLRLGEYTVVDRLGGGGMGQVFKAVHRRLERVVALKIIAPSILKDERAVKRFEREARVAGKLIHPHIVTAYDASEDRGIHFLVMEYVDGTTLKAIIETLRDEKRHFSAKEALYIVMEACRGLSYAHELTDDDGNSLHLVHRDVSPPNIMVTKRGEIKVADFGLAKATTQLEKTDPGVVKGKFSYLSPEAAS
ncbi:MAG: serine/threonine protein kinase, partial [Planctomycetales bacterium]|nr:serine/threonine protein kinase [Planctomycetales bacterium]